MKRRLKASEINHLRRLLGWVRCEYFMTPEEIVAAVNDNRAVLGEPSEDAKARLVAWHQKAARVPQYMRAAMKALQKVIDEENTDAEIINTRRAPKKLNRVPPMLTAPHEDSR